MLSSRAYESLNPILQKPTHGKSLTHGAHSPSSAPLPLTRCLRLVLRHRPAEAGPAAGLLLYDLLHLTILLSCSCSSSSPSVIAFLREGRDFPDQKTGQPAKSCDLVSRSRHVATKRVHAFPCCLFFRSLKQDYRFLLTPLKLEGRVPAPAPLDAGHDVSESMQTGPRRERNACTCGFGCKGLG